MCGEESISRIRDSWTKIVPTLLQMDGEVPTDSEETRSYTRHFCSLTHNSGPQE